jgi:microcompartment protein CcmL/EutN
MKGALGIIEAEGVAGIIAAADAAGKTADVELLGWESIGGITTLFFRGTVGEVAASLESGRAAAAALTEKVVAAPLNQPESACIDFIAHPTADEMDVPEGALGLLESRGYGAHMVASDRMVKVAPVQVYNLLTVHDRVVCTLINGEQGAVREAIASGRELFAQNEFFRCATVISRPLPQVLRAFAPAH